MAFLNDNRSYSLQNESLRNSKIPNERLTRAIGHSNREFVITQPPLKEGAWSALCSKLSKIATYVVKRSKRPLLEEVV